MFARHLSMSINLKTLGEKDMERINENNLMYKNKDKKKIEDCITVSFSDNKDTLNLDDILIEYISLKYIKL